MPKSNGYLGLALLVLTSSVWAVPDKTQLAVWANEAIVATYSYDYKNFLPRQKEIAKYFTAEGWIAYSTVFNASRLPDTVKANSYYVSAVATSPPEVKEVGANQWQAEMPLLVVYKNPQYQQQQHLAVTITFTPVAAGGIRGLAITSLQSQVTAPACQCQPVSTTETPADGQQQLPDAEQSIPAVKR
ncbi:DotI/IcmL family type IV secretion protein [Legionella fairfieldensis]|uniref:DotI/IcmL family type IV secretion protein n=1 Tax=Legionella fairfieldensis TaxID=45064 RepID=UPI000490BBD0|nr:DotI/IcmL family type IV secretion protein [Legionella fairfieldensis]